MLCQIIFALFFVVAVEGYVKMPIPNVPTTMPKENELPRLQKLIALPYRSVKFLNGLIIGHSRSGVSKLVGKRKAASVMKNLTLDNLVEIGHKCWAFCNVSEKVYKKAIQEKKDEKDILTFIWTKDNYISDELKKVQEDGLICEDSIDAMFDETTKYGQEYPEGMNLAALNLMDDIKPCVVAALELLKAMWQDTGMEVPVWLNETKLMEEIY